MKSSTLVSFLPLLVLLVSGCGGDGVPNPFSGSQWDIGMRHVGFSHNVAEWDTTHDRLVLKFELISGTKYPSAQVIVEGVSYLHAGETRDVPVTVSIGEGVTYECDPSDPDANATIVFSRFDLAVYGAVSGEITGMARHVEDPDVQPVPLNADFNDVVVIT